MGARSVEMTDSQPPPEGEAPRRGAEESAHADAREGQRASRPPPRARWTQRPSEPQDHSDDASDRKSRLEGLFRESVRKAIEKGVEAGLGTLTRADSKIREVVDDVKLPREIAGYLFSQIDETKNVLVRVVAREVREFLDATDLAQELQRALTSLSFEIKTEIRFVPNEAGGVKPVVRSKTTPRVHGTEQDDSDDATPD